MRHEIIRLPATGVELETYLTDNRAVEPDRRKPLVLIFPGGAYAYRSDRKRNRWMYGCCPWECRRLLSDIL